ncbi:MAG: phosphoribosylanthranilate isomerase [Kouleothrix sp.]|nr:phosphoribosylanthranilate isomerase [Kouleothrix sp.]
MTFVKICGLRTAEHALAALDTGADLLGFIFAPARRQISPSQAAAIGTAVRAAGRATLVGVFVNEAPERMLDIADTCGLDALQLSGDEPLAIARQLAGRELIKTVRLNQAAGEMDWLECDLPNVRLLVDAHVPGAYGGAGVVADWPRASALASRRPVILAGGLTPSNVGAAIRQVRPWAVDVSSGVETEGVKDVAKIRAFVAAARATEADRHAGP